jgi:Nif-specific regulatory protein
MERAVLICDNETITGIDLPPSLQTSDCGKDNNLLSLTGSVENFEKELIIEGLKLHNGNQTKTAESLNTSLRIINYKIHQYGIDPKKFKIATR